MKKVKDTEIWLPWVYGTLWKPTIYLPLQSLQCEWNKCTTVKAFSDTFIAFSRPTDLTINKKKPTTISDTQGEHESWTCVLIEEATLHQAILYYHLVHTELQQTQESFIHELKSGLETVYSLRYPVKSRWKQLHFCRPPSLVNLQPTYSKV
jgi:hypothetical protein